MPSDAHRGIRLEKARGTRQSAAQAPKIWQTHAASTRPTGTFTSQVNTAVPCCKAWTTLVKMKHCTRALDALFSPGFSRLGMKLQVLLSWMHQVMMVVPGTNVSFASAVVLLVDPVKAARCPRYVIFPQANCSTSMKHFAWLAS